MLPVLLILAAVDTVRIDVDVADQRPISPYIYGVNSPDWAGLGRGVTLARQGGNRMTAYNWETNASNAGNDWHFQNDGFLGDSNEPGWTVRTFMEAAQQHGAAVLLTVPTAGYVAADKNGDGDVNKTPDWLHVRFLKSIARKPGPFAYPPNTQDRVVYQDEFVAWIEKIKAKSTPVWFMLDNEPDLWGSTHQRIWPKNPTYAQIIANNIEFAGAIKAVAPDTLVFGPANYGWNGFRTFQNAPDGGGRDFLDVYLAAMREAEQRAGKRFLDVLDIHWYPEARGDNVRVTESGASAGTAAARIQAPRSLWDPSYVETSWITDSTGHKPIALLPTIEAQIAAKYPGTKFSISEYNYGGNNHISGAIAQADVLGIFGRYGLFAACNWGLSPKDKAEVAGFKAFTDYDRNGSRFGDRELGVTGAEAATESVYAALDSSNPRRLTVVAINKSGGPKTFRIHVAGFRGMSVKAYSVDAGNFALAPESTGATLLGEAVSVATPPLSVTTLEVFR